MTIQELLRVYGEDYQEALLFALMYLFLRDASIDQAEFTNAVNIVNIALGIVTLNYVTSDSVTTSESITVATA